MRITNDNYSPSQLVSELATRETCKWNKIGEFFDEEKSSHDWLVEAWTERLDTILNFFQRHGTQAKSTQSFRDQGIDVYLEFDSDAGKKRVGFQLKSEREVERDKRGKEKHGIITKLKIQAFDAMRSQKVDELWIVPCFNYDRHKKLIHDLSSEISAGSFVHNNMDIKVLDPREAVSFLSKDDGQISALCTLFLCQDDEVLNAAVNEVDDLTDFQRKCVLSFIWQALEGDITVANDDVAYLETNEEYDICNEYDSLIERVGFMEHGEGDGFIVRPHSLPGICALYFEGRVRHNMPPSAAKSYVLALLERDDEVY
jgi:hypothetical protein